MTDKIDSQQEAHKHIYPFPYFSVEIVPSFLVGSSWTVLPGAGVSGVGREKAPCPSAPQDRDPQLWTNGQTETFILHGIKDVVGYNHVEYIFCPQLLYFIQYSPHRMYQNRILGITV